MGQTRQLKASDGHSFSAYEAKPSGKPKGGLVIIQEIFGVNAHIRNVTDRYAALGYDAIAPALFDRTERQVDLGYEQAEVQRGIALRQKISLDDMLLDIAASVEAVKGAGKVAIVGYCLGGSLAWLAAAKTKGLAAAVGYYGGMVAKNLDAKPKVPVMLHFGALDSGIPVGDVEAIRAAVDPKQVQVFLYEGAGHAFNRDGNKAWHEPSAKLALDRTTAFLSANLT